MSRTSRRKKRREGASGRRGGVHSDARYRTACAMARSGDLEAAQQAFEGLLSVLQEDAGRAVVENSLGALAASRGDLTTARSRFEKALEFDGSFATARKNLAVMDAASTPSIVQGQPLLPRSPLTPDPSPARGRGEDEERTGSGSTRIAILSLLFNWPSTGGGTVHTAELGKFLGQAGYDVRHFYAVYPEWGLGNVTESTGVPSVPLEFQPPDWNAASIQKRFRDLVDEFDPDYVVITDTWNFKSVLADAMRGYRYFLRLAALECLCPLNNVRLLIGEKGEIAACPRHQLATPDICRDCVAAQGQRSGSLHQAERALSGFGTTAYSENLLRAFAEAEGVLVVNPLIATMVSPFAKKVHVVPSGFDQARFPWPPVENQRTRGTNDSDCRAHSPCDPPYPPLLRGGATPLRLIFAGLVDEYMKGFHVVHDACAKLWGKRHDFELVATADPVGQVDEFTRYIGWQSQNALPAAIREADILVFPTIAEEALGRSAVEAMGAGKPVIASRIGGLQFTVADGASGLLCEPGNVDDLAAKIEMLLEDPELRHRMGEAGRRRFEEHFIWEAIINRHYKQLMPLRVTPRKPSRPDQTESANRSPVVPRPIVRDVRYTPSLVPRVDHSRLLADAAAFFGMEHAELARMWETYREYSERQEYAQRFGELKTLSTEEAFLIGILLSLARPPQIVELGTQHGKSTRRLVDLQNFLGQGSRIISYDVVDELQFVGRDEIEFHREDLTGRFRGEVLDRYDGGLVFCDVHPYPLLSEVVRETTEHPANWILAVHDCCRGLCNPRMRIGRDDPHITSDTGIWERYVLAERFGIEDPLSPELDIRQTAGRSMRIFETQHGLALDVPATICAGDAAGTGGEARGRA